VGWQVILNVGHLDGVKPHQCFKQTEYGQVYDPDTHEELGTVKRETTLVSAIEIFPRYCVCLVITPTPLGWTTGMVFEWGEKPFSLST
jgi:hypothetical protein